MTGIIASLRAVFTPDEQDRDRSSDDRIESVAAESSASVTEQSPDVASGQSVTAFEVPDRPTDTYHELGMSPEALFSELIRANGGWTWQDDLVAATEWSKSTVSRYLSDMEADGRIARVPVGRENVVGFPDVLDEGALNRTRREGHV